MRQSCPPTPGQPHKEPFHIPLALGLLDAEGRDLPLRLAGEDAPSGTTRVLELREPDAIEAAARRELREEAGCKVGESFAYLGKFFSSPGFTDEHTHQFVATDVAWDRSAVAHDGEEQILEVKSFSAAELRNMVADQIIEDANTLGLYARLEAGGWLS